MARYHTQYVKKHYVKRDIKRELYEAFIEWCGEKSINICLEKALNIILRGNIQSNIQSIHSQEHSQEISRGNVGVNIGGNIGGKSSGKHYTSCLSPQEVKKIKNFEAYKAWIDKNFTLHRWWREEDGSVCFETSKPVEIRKKELS
jgi:hypothetical protein